MGSGARTGWMKFGAGDQRLVVGDVRSGRAWNLFCDVVSSGSSAGGDSPGDRWAAANISVLCETNSRSVGNVGRVVLVQPFEAVVRRWRVGVGVPGSEHGAVTRWPTLGGKLVGGGISDSSSDAEGASKLGNKQREQPDFEWKASRRLSPITTKSVTAPGIERGLVRDRWRS